MSITPIYQYLESIKNKPISTHVPKNRNARNPTAISVSIWLSTRPATMRMKGMALPWPTSTDRNTKKIIYKVLCVASYKEQRTASAQLVPSVLNGLLDSLCMVGRSVMLESDSRKGYDHDHRIVAFSLMRMSENHIPSIKPSLYSHLPICMP